MHRIAVVVYGYLCYLIFLITLIYGIGFVGNLVVPKSIDSGAAGLSLSSLIINVILLAIFAAQHTVMARAGFKRWWTQFVSKSIERSTYVLFSSLPLILSYWLWQPMPAPVWTVENPFGRALLWALFGIGWGMVLASTFMIDHFELFGLSQVHAHMSARAKTSPL